MRDEFSETTKRNLATRVGHRCSKPTCCQITCGPEMTGPSTVNLGVAAHITAASQGGPRFDGNLTKEQRSSEENGIWLCQNCAKLVDDDPSHYTDALLREWKQTAESQARHDVHGARGQAVGGEELSITFRCDDWKMWKERGNLPGDMIVVIRPWARGDVRYSAEFWIRNNMEDEIVLHRFRLEFMDGPNVVSSDEAPFWREPVKGKSLRLPPKIWCSIPIDHGFYDAKVFERAKDVVCVASIVGSSDTRRWSVIENINHEAVTFL